MAKLTQNELQNLKKLIQLQDITYKKMNIYASQTTDSQIKQIFTKSAQDSLNIKHKLISFLNN